MTTVKDGLQLLVQENALNEIQVVCMTNEMDDACKVQQILAIVRTTLDPNYVGE